jgi:hypothetical protein
MRTKIKNGGMYRTHPKTKLTNKRVTVRDVSKWHKTQGVLINRSIIKL